MLGVGRQVNRLNPDTPRVTRYQLLWLGLALVLAACGSAPAPTYNSLGQRPVVLSNLSAGSACSPSPPGTLVGLPAKWPAYGFGKGPVYLSGQTDWYSGQQATLLVSPRYKGIVLLRGRQLDGDQGLPFAAAGQDRGRIELPLSSSTSELPGSSGSGWRIWTSTIVATGPACFGLQFDGATFTETLIFQLKKGAVPPG